MPEQTPLDYESAPDALIDGLLGRLANDRANVEVHRELRVAALKRTANGGPPAGMLARMHPLPRHPVRRLIHVERLWSLDPGNTDWLVKVAGAIERCAAKRPEIDFDPVLRWLMQLAEASRTGA